jgi:hypothetical protein
MLLQKMLLQGEGLRNTFWWISIVLFDSWVVEEEVKRGVGGVDEDVGQITRAPMFGETSASALQKITRSSHLEYLPHYISQPTTIQITRLSPQATRAKLIIMVHSKPCRNLEAPTPLRGGGEPSLCP